MLAKNVFGGGFLWFGGVFRLLGEIDLVVLEFQRDALGIGETRVRALVDAAHVEILRGEFNAGKAITTKKRRVVLDDGPDDFRVRHDDESNEYNNL